MFVQIRFGLNKLIFIFLTLCRSTKPKITQFLVQNLNNPKRTSGTIYWLIKTEKSVHLFRKKKHAPLTLKGRTRAANVAHKSLGLLPRCIYQASFSIRLVYEETGLPRTTMNKSPKWGPDEGMSFVLS